MKINYVGDFIEDVNKKGLNENFSRFGTNDIINNKALCKLLNKKDRDILFLIFVSHKKQKTVQRILRRSQPSLVYDIRRIRERIQFIVYLKKIFDVFLNFLENRSNLYDKKTVEILIMMYYTTSLTQTAITLKCAQIFVRYMFEKALKKMRKMGHWDIYEIFSIINKNKNKVKRTYKESQEIYLKNHTLKKHK